MRVYRQLRHNLFQACAAEPACIATHPHLEETLTGLVNKLEAEPLTAAVRDRVTGEDVKVVLDGGALVDWLRNQTYSVPTLQAAPNWIDGLAAGHPDAIEAIALDRAKSGASILATVVVGSMFIGPIILLVVVPALQTLVLERADHTIPAGEPDARQAGR